MPAPAPPAPRSATGVPTRRVWRRPAARRLPPFPLRGGERQEAPASAVASVTDAEVAGRSGSEEHPTNPLIRTIQEALAAPPRPAAAAPSVPRRRPAGCAARPGPSADPPSARVGLQWSDVVVARPERDGGSGRPPGRSSRPRPLVAGRPAVRWPPPRACGSGPARSAPGSAGPGTIRAATPTPPPDRRARVGPGRSGRTPAPPGSRPPRARPPRPVRSRLAAAPRTPGATAPAPAAGPPLPATRFGRLVVFPAGCASTPGPPPGTALPSPDRIAPWRGRIVSATLAPTPAAAGAPPVPRRFRG